MAWLNKPDDTRQTWHHCWPALLTSYSQFCYKFCCHGNGGRSGKCNWQHSMAHPRKPSYRRKNLPKICYASQVITNFVPNFVAMATGSVGENCNRQHLMAHPRKPPIGAKISYASQVIANFVPNCVAMATRVGRGKMQLAAFDGPYQKTPL